MDDLLITFMGTSLTIVGVNSILMNVYKPYKLHKSLSEQDNCDFKLDKIPDCIALSDKTLNTASLSEDVKKIIEEFITVFQSKGIKLDNFYANFRPYRIHIDEETTDTVFSYNPCNKNMYASKKGIHSSLLPTLIYLAASKDEFENTDSAGFIRSNNDDIIGYSITSSYVNILANRYFGIPFPSQGSDPKDLLTAFIEKLVGREFMERAFFDCALEDLIEELCKYSTREIAFKTIREMDHLAFAYKEDSSVFKLLCSNVYKDLVHNLSCMGVRKILEESGNVFEMHTYVKSLVILMESKYINLPAFYRYPNKKRDELISKLQEELKKVGIIMNISINDGKSM